MKDLPPAILEGLIHNVRTPLNLILGYVHRLKQRVDCDEADQIYKAGIKLEDILQETWEAIQIRGGKSSKTALNTWLNAELSFLQNYLEIKHRFLFTPHFFEKEVLGKISPISLSEWFEALLLHITSKVPENQITMQIFVTLQGLKIFASGNNLLASVLPEDHSAKYLCFNKDITVDAKYENANLVIVVKLV
ncbi:MAG: hypothetical protein ABFC98_02225 [Candidatus Cloacimonas sp.]